MIEMLGTEKELMEGILNRDPTNHNSMLALAFLSLMEGWHADKLLYYRGLMKELEDSYKN